MKNPVTILALAVLPLAALCAQLPRLPPPAFADTEVSTNIPFAVGLDAMRIALAFAAIAAIVLRRS